MSNVAGGDPKAHKPESHIPIWTAIIAALSGIVVAGIGLYGTLQATDSTIVSGPQTSGPTVTRTVTIAPTATETVTEPADGASPDSNGGSAEPSPTITAYDANWNTSLATIDAETGDVVAMDCPARGVLQDIYGGQDGLYAGRSSICTAAVHDDRISRTKGGRVQLMVREAAEEYPSLRKMGITSGDLSSRGLYGSFEFLPPRSG